MLVQIEKRNSSNINVKEAIENWNERMKQMSHMHESCVRKIEREKNRQAAYYNKGKREYAFEVGQQVWKKNTKLSSKAEGYSAKLGLPRVGPYTIYKMLGDTTYLIEKDGKIEKSL